MMSLLFISQWLGALSLVVSILTGIWTLINRSTKHYDDKIDKFDEGLTDHGKRIQDIESELKHLPSSRDVTALTLLVTKLQGDMNVLDNSIKTLTRTVDRMDRALREESK